MFSLVRLALVTCAFYIGIALLNLYKQYCSGLRPGRAAFSTRLICGAGVSYSVLFG